MKTGATKLHQEPKKQTKYLGDGKIRGGGKHSQNYTKSKTVRIKAK